MILCIIAIIVSILACFVFYRNKEFDAFKLCSLICCVDLLVFNSVKAGFIASICYNIIFAVIFLFKCGIDYSIVKTDVFDENRIILGTILFSVLAIFTIVF